MNTFCRWILGIVFAIAVASFAAANDRCVPFGGTGYGWATDNWYVTGDFVIGHKVRHANVVVVNIGFSDNGGVSTGTEISTFDFGNGNTFQTKQDFVVQHLNDVLTDFGVFDVQESGTFFKGTGIFKGIYGHWVADGPFGSNVKLPDNIHPDPNASMYWIGRYHGTICGMR
jgi:hypothetical protein